MITTTQMLKLLGFLATILVSAQASDEPALVLTNTPSASSNFTAPTSAPTVTVAPSALGICSNTPGFSVTEWNKFQREWHLQTLGCDDILVDCYEFGNLGQVQDHCCKCRTECEGQCNELVFTEPEPRDDTSDSGTVFFTLFIPGACFVGLCVLFGLCLLRRKERRIAREAMLVRRLHHERRENNGGLTEEENANQRFEQFVTKFYFQTVSADKSNISAESIRKSNTGKDEETPTEKSTSVDEGDVGQQSSSARSVVSEQLASWTQPSTKHECCICLDAYIEGETICAPTNTNCMHVFHESCIKVWLLKNDQCPLCRVDLLADKTVE